MSPHNRNPIPGRLYEAPAYAVPPASPVFWQVGTQPDAHPMLEGEAETDVLIIGAGYAGLNCARRLAAAGRTVAVLEAAQPGWGASGRNGGFCCIGGDLLGLEAIARRWGEGDAVHYARTQREAIAYVDELLYEAGESEIRQGHGEVRLAHHRRVYAGFAEDAVNLDRWYGVKPELLTRAELAERGAHVNGAYGGLYYPLGFGIQPWRYITGLTRLAAQAGANIFGNSPVLSLTHVKGRWRAVTPQGQLNATTVVIATNGYSSDLIPTWLAGRYLPVLSHIIVTRPLSDAELTVQGFTTDLMTYDSRRLLHYFRLLPDRRFMFGMRGGLSAGERSLSHAKVRIRRDFELMFPAWSHVPHEFDWSGLVCLNGHGMPFAGAVPGLQNAYTAFGWHGNGVALASYSGNLLAGAILGEKNHIPAVMQLVPRRFPFACQRRLWLGAAYGASWLLDRFGR